MTDIVERLRGRFWPKYSMGEPDLQAEAADEIVSLRARLAEAEELLREAEVKLANPLPRADFARNLLRRIRDHFAADSASAVQPERCCLDYPRCDCNSPPEPDDDWLCFQRPAQPKVTP